MTPAPASASPGDAAPQSGTTPDPDGTPADDAAGAAASTSGDDPAGSIPAGSVPEPGIAPSDSSSVGPADGEPVTGRSEASPATGGTVVAPAPPPPGTAAPGTSVEDPHRGTPPPGRPPAPSEPGPGSYAGPPTAPPHVPFPGGDPAARPPGYHQPPSVPARVPAPPGRQAIRPSTPPPAPPAPPATGRLRRLPVALLVVAVLIAGLAYVGYRQLTGGPPEGFRAVTSPGYELAVPQAWTPPAPGTPTLTVFGVPFGTAGQYGDYPCQTGNFPRAVAASALIAVPPNVGLDQAATAFARGSADALYPGTGAQVAVGTPAERALSTVTGSKVEATVRTDGAGGCRATDATVQVLVVPRTTAPDGSIGAAVLIVSGDLRGGPPQPAPLTRDELVGVLDTAALSTG